MILILPGNHVANLFQRTGCHGIVGRTPANQAIVISGDFKWESAMTMWGMRGSARR